jgi:phosphatidylglycerophosphate synthase
MSEANDRRPIATRSAGWVQALSRRLAETSITPNQISIASMIAAALAGAAFWASGHVDGPGRLAMLLVAAVGCQLRLLCNLLDGLVAVEGGKRAPDGGFWNEFPDRIADILIIAGIGLGAGAPALGWAAATMAVLTAYTRELGRTCGAPADFSGPMAKPHRMAVATGAALLAMFEPLIERPGWTLHAALWAIAIGAAWTVLRRAMRIVGYLRKGNDDGRQK